jgi:hypothetical protein
MGIAETLALITVSANRTLGQLAADISIPHIFTVAISSRGQLSLGAISNVDIFRFQPVDWLTGSEPVTSWSTHLRPTFDLWLPPNLGSPICFATGRCGAIRDNDRDVLRRISKRRPRSETDYMNVLASINRRASEHPEHGAYISSTCLASHMPSTGLPVTSKVYAWGQSFPDSTSVVPMLVFGIDLTEITKDMHIRYQRLGVESDEVARQRGAVAAERAVKRREI